MTNIKDIFNVTLNECATVEKSLYYEQGDKVIRYSDHLPNYDNFLLNNSEAKEVLLVFVNAKCSEEEIQKSIDDAVLPDEITIDYLLFDEDDNYLNDIDYLTRKIKFFLT